MPQASQNLTMLSSCPVSYGPLHGGEVCVLPAASSDDVLSQLQEDVGDLVGAGDGRALQGGQVGRLNLQPTGRLQVNHHQLLLSQHHLSVGVIKGSRTVHLNEKSKVDDSGDEVRGCLLAVVDHRDAVAVPIASPQHATLEDGEGQPLLGGQPEDVGNSFARKRTKRHTAVQGLWLLGITGHGPLAVAAVRMAAIR